MGGLDVFVAKYSKDGAHLWSRGFGGTESDRGRGVATDGEEIVITGRFGSEVVFGDQTLASSGGSDIYVAKLAADATVTWAARFGGVGDDDSHAVTVDGNGNIIVAGEFTGTTIPGEPAKALTSRGGSDAFVAKYDPSGQHLWSQRYGESNDDVGRGVAVDSAGNIYVTGSLDARMFLAGYSASGTRLFVKTYPGPNRQRGSSVAVDSDDRVMVTGGFYESMSIDRWKLFCYLYDEDGQNEDILVARADNTGSALWAGSWGGSRHDRGTSIAVHETGVYVAGHFDKELFFDEIDDIVVPPQSYDIFVLKLTAP